MQSPTKMPLQCLCQDKGAARSAANCTQQPTNKRLLPWSKHRVPSWLENETMEKHSPIGMLKFSGFDITRFSVGKSRTFQNILKIRARSRCSPQCGAGSCNTSCTGSAKYLTQAVAKEPRCTLTLRSQNKHPA